VRYAVGHPPLATAFADHSAAPAVVVDVVDVREPTAHHRTPVA
jgi:hypothetical protein